MAEDAVSVTDATSFDVGKHERFALGGRHVQFLYQEAGGGVLVGDLAVGCAHKMPRAGIGLDRLGAIRMRAAHDGENAAAAAAQIATAETAAFHVCYFMLFLLLLLPMWAVSLRCDKGHRTSDNGRFAKSDARSPKSFLEMSCNGQDARCPRAVRQ